MAAGFFIVVVGCGRLGSHPAEQLRDAGHNVVIIDRNPAAFDKTSPDYRGVP
jgi:trk system potassium uptake protein TrkA